eukprot:SAG22_NODE_2132_length_2962_cov_1.578414_3_plen_75_part_00
MCCVVWVVALFASVATAAAHTVAAAGSVQRDVGPLLPTARCPRTECDSPVDRRLQLPRGHRRELVAAGVRKGHQ